MNPQTPEQNLHLSFVNAVDDDENNDRISLIQSHDGNFKAPCTPNKSSPSSKRWILVVLLMLMVGVVMIFVALGLLHALQDLNATRATRSVHGNSPISKLGWLNTIEELRLKLAAVSADMKNNNTESQVVDITPLCDLIDYALETVGVRGVYFELFEGLEYYIPEDENCIYHIGHGVGCGWHDIWWLKHYFGAYTAEKLLQDGYLLLDRTTGEKLDNAVSFMHELHKMQERPYTGDMSFHAEHGFIYHYLTATQPDLKSYPLELADQFCGDYLIKNKRSHSASKNIGSECYHGFGHAVFTVVATRQLGEFDHFTARRQFRPNGGFVLSDEAICQGFEICKDAPDIKWVPLKYCHGGFKHSQQLFSKEFNEQEARDEFFDAHQKRCGIVDNEALSERKKKKLAKKQKTN
jgi:hypothetical protein